MRPTQATLYKKLLNQGLCSPEEAAVFSARMIDQGYLAKDLDYFSLPSVAVLRTKSAEQNVRDTGLADDPRYKIAISEAKLAIYYRRVAKGMEFDDLLEVGFHVITNPNETLHGQPLRGKELRLRIRDRIKDEVATRRRTNLSIGVAMPLDAERRSWDPYESIPPGDRRRRRSATPTLSRRAPGNRVSDLRLLGIDRLTEKENLILAGLQEEGATHGSVARSLGITRSVVERLLAKLRKRAAKLSQ